MKFALSWIARRCISSGLAVMTLSWAVSAAPPNVRYVAADAPAGGDGLSWATAYGDLQAAIAAAGSSGGAVNELWVKQGTYYPAPVGSTARSASFAVGNGLGVYGGFAGTEMSRDERDPAAHVTTLNGDLGGLSKRVYHVVTITGTGGVLSGVTVRGGRHDEFVQGNAGGGVYIGAAASAAIDRCVITDNHVYGIAFTAPGTVPGRGAGIFCAPGSTLTLSDSTIVANLGGVLPPGTPSVLPRTYGGGLAGDTCTVDAVGCTFSANKASSGLFYPCMGGTTTGTTGGHGGGMYFTASHVRLESCIIDSNRAGAGGSRPTCSGGEGNGTAGGSGGGIYVDNTSTVALSNCIVTANNAGMGGFGSSSSAGQLGGNGAAGGSGGGISAPGSTVSMINCLVSDNLAGTGGSGGQGSEARGSGGSGGSGGGVSALGLATTRLTNTTIAGNHFGAGGARGSGSGTGGAPGADGVGAGVQLAGTVTIANSILWDSDISEAVISGSPLVTYSDVRGGLAGSGNINADPQFTTGVGGSYHLGATSPCIDAGNNLADGDPATPGTQPLPATDLDGAGRRVDIAAVADTGLGSPPIVDMGAYEVQNPCVVDLTGDGLVDFGDYLEFLNLYDAGDPRVDFTGDGIVDFGDYLEFLNLFEAGC